MNRRQMLRAALAPALVVGFGTACSEPQPAGSIDVVDPGAAATPAPSPTPSQPPAPLTGLPVSAAPVAARQAVAVPIRVTPSSAPAGLGSADLVYVEFAESDSLHLTAVFQSRDAAKVGPVTEIRPVDIRSVGVLRPFVGYDGGPTGFLSQFEKSGLTGVTPADDGDKVFTSDYTSTAALWKAAPKGGQPPTPVFDYATAGTALAARDLAPARELTVTVSGGPPMVWRYDEQKSLWVGKVGTTTVTAASVIVLTMEYRTLDVRHPSPRSLPSANVFGEGAVVAVSGPSSAKGAWRKPGQQLVCNVADLGGDLLHPQAGNAWVIYAPTTAKVTVR
ncbi:MULTISPECIES: DUF3048 domain-containing protein [Micromonospora]|uniref:DUF3048 domain-containing protein n=1 Tax=Micromonospora sicca TaxID=2202420 RepID=A0A317DR24_9ACTN|nr:MULTISPECIES: DUF3048 domain-containing protein [unclassified Micromonospora]MBM0226827.1 DUF3048 domain-containing protein [Micromonospora sp. ATA51]PWR17199.1 DUF3048 domain-containing protein [Micromonospora sp. 4G51]